MNKIMRLKDCAFYVSQKINSEILDKNKFVSTENILQNRLGKTIASFTPKNNTKVTHFKPKDILIANIRPYLKKIWFANHEGGCSADVLVLRAKSHTDSSFLYYSLFRDDFFSYIMKGAKGTRMPRGDKEQILNFNIPNMNYQNQKKIGELLFLLDKKIELNNRINAELEAMAKTLYDYWFVQFDFPNEDGKPYKSSGGKMVYNSILKREIPVMFSEGVLDNLGQIVGGSTPDTKDCDNFCIKGVPWITPNDLSNNQGNKYISKGEKNVSDKGIKSASLKKYPLGTVLLTSRAPIGYMAIARKEFTTNQGFKSFIPNKGYPTDFVYYTIKNSLSIIIQFASGSTFKEISTTVLKTVPIVLPPLHIVKDFTNKIYSLTKKQNILEQECSELRNLRDWLLPMLMNGQVTVK